MTVVRAEGLTKVYGATRALDGLDLTVARGETCGLIGPNGSGKTTFLGTLLDFVRPTAGRVVVFERPTGDPALRARIGYVPERIALPEHYRGGELLHFFAALSGVPRALRRERVDAVTTLLDLGEAVRGRVARYSKGIRQRMAIAQALVHEPDLLVLDEPTANLDVVARRRFAEIVADLKRQGRTIVLTSHLLSEVEALCDRVAILERGRLVRAGTPAELGATGAVRLHLGQVSGEALERLASTAAEVTVGAGRATAVCRDGATEAAVRACLAEQGVPILRAEPLVRGLEDVFVAAVGEGRRG